MYNTYPEHLRTFLFLYLAALAVISLMPFGGMNIALNDITVLSLRGDYLMHIIVFLPLVPVWKMALPTHPWWVVLPFSLMISACAEGLQYYIPYRSFNINDLLGNMTGVVLGAVLLLLVNKLISIRLFVRKNV